MNRIAVPFHGRIIGFPYWNKVGGAAPFSPTDIAGLKLWLKSDAGLYQERTGASATTPASADGDPVGSWLDQSGNANHVTAASDAKRPTLKLAIQNSRAVVRFDGSDDLLATATVLAAGNAWSAIIGFKISTGTGYPFYNGEFGTGNGFGLNINTNRQILFRAVAFATDAAATNNFEIWSARRTAAPLTTLQVNAADASLTNSTSSQITPTTQTVIGAAHQTSGGWLTGDICEVLFFNVAISDADRALCNAYLNTRWAIY